MRDSTEGGEATSHRRFRLWSFLLSLPVPAAIFYWLGWSLVEGEFRLPSPRPSMRLSPVRLHSEPLWFVFWAVVLGALGLYCLSPAISELRRLFKRPDGALPDPPETSDSGPVEYVESVSETVISTSTEITVVDSETGETRTYDSLDDLPANVRQLLDDARKSHADGSDQPSSPDDAQTS